eukprot:CAMPEP_0169190142 /NCGR_PEP_ID=MMETSP1016-20121227/4375_1 /TAXON_ID=342587 /ORGANISM="Karlodinium micrum, Strain CCMP2283" /LENGTH=178 /DNA_ID=CAMNT_0009266299 /DNA_START=108 /DNA_END=641 /DNA_ORIENTATION=-
MTKSGWIFELGHRVMEGAALKGWSDGRDIGSVSLRIGTAGQLTLDVANVHAANDADNEVFVLVNNDHVMTYDIGKNIRQKFCLQVEGGDIVKLLEIYGQIQLLSAYMSCSQKQAQDDEVVSIQPGIFSSTDNECVVAQEVRMPGRRCDIKEVMDGRVDQVLNESHAIVKLIGDVPHDS